MHQGLGSLRPLEHQPVVDRRPAEAAGRPGDDDHARGGHAGYSRPGDTRGKVHAPGPRPQGSRPGLLAAAPSGLGTLVGPFPGAHAPGYGDGARSAGWVNVFLM